jgi:hypothetical protein
MSNGLNKPSIRQQQRSLSERLQALEENTVRLLVGINQRFELDDKRLISLEELVEALANLQGLEEVQEFVDAKRIERARAASAAEKAALDQGIADGYMVVAPVVDEKSLLVLKYTNADGSVIEPGRVQLPAEKVQPQFKDQILGKGVGTIIDLPGGAKCELLEIYGVDEAKHKEVQAAKAAAQAALQATAPVEAQ